MFDYLSHTITSDLFYNKYKNDKKIINNSFSKDYFKTYSLGITLSSKKLGSIPRIYGSQKLFLNMINQIQEKNLTKDENALNLLYGHISHYFYDININPYITYLSLDLKKTSKITPEKVIKSYLSNYLSQKTYNKNILELKENCFSKTKINETSKFIINNTYKKIYNKENIHKSYKQKIKTLKHLENTKNNILIEETIKKLIDFKNFLITNNLTTNEILNKEKNIWYNPITGGINNASYDELIDKAISDIYFAIKEVNKILYQDKDKLILEDLFQNLSYDTGIDLKLTEKKYYRKRELKWKIIQYTKNNQNK